MISSLVGGYSQTGKRYQVLMKMWRRGNPLALLVGMSIDTATLENSMAVSQKIKK